MPDRSHQLLLSAVLSLGLLSGCLPGPVPTATGKTAERAVRQPLLPSTPTVAVPGDAQAPPAEVVSSNAGSLSGTITLPSHLLSNNGAGIISDQGAGYRVLAMAQKPVANVVVALLNATGEPITDETGQALTAKTDASGRYGFNSALPAQNMVLAVQLPEAKGTVRAVVPKGATEADGDLISTLTTTYILEQYVRGQQPTFEKLPAHVERETRQKALAAVEAAEVEAPEALTADHVLATVEALREQDPAFDAQLEMVKRLLLAGLSDQGAGLDARSLVLDAKEIALGPEGQVYYVGHRTKRVWKIDAQHRLVPVAGDGRGVARGTGAAAGEPAEGDGGPAVKVAIDPVAIAFDSAGHLYLADRASHRIRKVDPSGVITTFASSAAWSYLTDLAFMPDGSLLVATHSALDRVRPDGGIETIAGQHRPFKYLEVPKITIAGDGGPATAATFAEIVGLAVDPLSGDVFLADYKGKIRKLSSGVISAVAGYGTSKADDVAAMEAGFSGYRLNLGLTPEGHLLVEDGLRIRRIADGVVTTVAGSPAADAPLSDGPALERGIGANSFAFRSDGSLLVATGDRVREVKDGLLTTLAGKFIRPYESQPADQAQLTHLGDLFYDRERHAILCSAGYYLYELDLASNVIKAIAGAGENPAPFAEGAPAFGTNIDTFGPLFEDADGSLGFSARIDKHVRRILRLRDGKVTTIAGEKDKLEGNWFNTDAPSKTHFLLWPSALVLKAADTYYVTVRGTATIRQFKEGEYTRKFAGYGTSRSAGSPAVDFKFGQLVTGVAIGPDGAMYVGEVGGIFRIDMATGLVTSRVVGTGTMGTAGLGGPANEAQISYAESIKFDAAGNMFFTDIENHRVCKWDRATNLLTAVAGEGAPNLNGTTYDDAVAYPVGLAFDRDGHMYVSTAYGGQIKRVPKDRL